MILKLLDSLAKDFSFLDLGFSSGFFFMIDALRFLSFMI